MAEKPRKLEGTRIDHSKKPFQLKGPRESIPAMSERVYDVHMHNPMKEDTPFEEVGWAKIFKGTLHDHLLWDHDDYKSGMEKAGLHKGSNCFEIMFEPQGRLKPTRILTLGPKSEVPPLPEELRHKMFKEFETRVAMDYPDIDGLVIYTGNPKMSKIAEKSGYTLINGVKAHEHTEKPNGTWVKNLKNSEK